MAQLRASTVQTGCSPSFPFFSSRQKEDYAQQNMFYDFLRGRSPSHHTSKKRRSRSADALPVSTHIPTPATHPRHSSLDNAPVGPPSQPLSSATNPVVIGEQLKQHRKKITIFGIPIPSRRSSLPKSRPTTPKRTIHEPMLNSTNGHSPDEFPARVKYSIDMSEPDSGLGHETIAALKSTRRTPPSTPKQAPAPKPKPRRSEPMNGRSSPLVGFFTRDKGKEREREPGSRVASPESGRDSRASTTTASISGPRMNKPRVPKQHAPFDFERPISASVGSKGGRSRQDSRVASVSEMGRLNGNGHQWQAGSTTYVIHEERSPLARSNSTGGRIRFEDPPKKATGQKSGLLTVPVGTTSGQTTSWGRAAGKRHGAAAPNSAAHPAFSFEPAMPSQPERKVNDRGVSGNDRYAAPISRSAGKGRSLDLGIELNWAPTRVREEAVMSLGKSRARWREEAEVKDVGRRKVSQAFEQVLGETGYAQFREYIHRFDARLIPLEGPSGLLYKVQRLLDTTAKGLDEQRKRDLLERFDHVVQQQQR